MKSLVYSIDSIEFNSHGEAGKTKIIASGQVNTGSWTGHELKDTGNLDANNFMIFDLVAIRPEGIVTQGFVKFVTSSTINTKGLIGVTVKASNNSISKKYGT